MEVEVWVGVGCLYCGFDDNLKIRRQGRETTASGKSSFQSLTLRGKNVLLL